jgi:hypothetical protein
MSESAAVTALSAFQRRPQKDETFFGHGEIYK